MTSAAQRKSTPEEISAREVRIVRTLSNGEMRYGVCFAGNFVGELSKTKAGADAVADVFRGRIAELIQAEREKT